AFTITPDIGYHIADVVVDGSSIGATGSYTFVNITTNHTIVAFFAINTYTITAKAEANGSITPSGTLTISHGATRAFTITPDIGYHIADVLVDGSPVGATGSYTFVNITTNHSIVVAFATNTYTITAQAEANGSITPSGTLTIRHGATRTFTITPDTGYHIADVVVDGSSVGATGSYTFVNITTNHSIAAAFAINIYIITAQAEANGSITPSGTLTINYGATRVFTITPDTGYHIADVVVDESSVGATGSYTFINVTSSHTIAAAFAINTYTITAQAEANGNITPSGTLTINYGATQTFTIDPDTNYYIADVMVDGHSIGATESYTFVNITSSHIIATFFVSAGDRIVYVNSDIGNDTYDGSSPTFQGSIVGPRKTIQAGLNIYNIGGTVSVAAGTYTEAIYISKWISLIGAGATQTTIDASGIGTASTVNFEGTTTNKAIIDGFRITGATGSLPEGNGIYCKDGADPAIINNIIVANRLNGIYCSNGSSPTINSNTITSK
ncbi:hypothetical protein HY792_03470, partial [Candidatus Desantisbacteria bacterium]|nr:hypothetical protein [Candidatus Desantisbacteria bacterium]